MRENFFPWEQISGGALALLLVSGCASAPRPDPVALTQAALTASSPATAELAGTAAAAAVKRFENFSEDLSAANITNHLAAVYAPELYFRDPFREIHGLPGFQAYLLRDSAAVADYKIDWQDVAQSRGDFYLRWIMSVKLKRDGKNDPPVMTCGISHLRFSEAGKVIFEQDYFDAAGFLYERLPVLGWEIRLIKKHL